ncbi:MAG: hypothetical protein HOG03_15300 [Desulfobacula sp.]|jgi:hypothetical protein|uniref:hypothetical protein n=1 Tax=Desulfobacula sp. TaxID=2593537 RepID=UPI001DA65F4D|nr:hypothetical protein [Desulfobacula sp.]MBT3484005.1 hypothetical protein [Desulfobacula sp.]MBT3805947.1 hypothetical protein [Desulfobacula sp.]MBT4026368.1 hypothetical protein [Desulfobacula sp.]MBT4198087.1 hypothetical protein [Desulfobacula sp.]
MNNIPAYSDLSGQVFKDLYTFDFLGSVTPRLEADLETKGITRYPKLFSDVDDLTAKLENHLRKMSFVW